MTFLDPRVWFAGIGIAAIMFVAGYATRWYGESNRTAKSDLAVVTQQSAQHNQATQFLEGKKDEREQFYSGISNDAAKLDSDSVRNRDCIGADSLRLIERSARGSR
jgi:hypothetical protein